MTRQVDAVVIGSGHNGLVAAAYLARAGWDVEVLERNAVPGGAVATEELTEPGYLHDTFSGWHPLFHLSAAYAELGSELAARGLEYMNSDDVLIATARSDGGTVLGFRDPDRTAEGFGPEDGARYVAALQDVGKHMDVIGELFGTELRSWHAARLALRLGRRLGVRDGLRFGSDVASTARGWLERFDGPAPGELLAPWVLHAGVSPEESGGGLQLPVIAGALHQVGLPVARGGSKRFVDAFVRLIEDHGGRVRPGVEVDSITTRRGRAIGVIASDEEIVARRAIIANVTPTQLYGRLLRDADGLARECEQARGYRFSARGGMQIHLALGTPPRWRDPALLRVPVIHVTDGLDAVSRACGEAVAGLLPARATIVCGQPTAVDPSRAPEGAWLLWIQLQEVPYRPVGDAARELDVGDGTWSDELTDAYADRIVGRLGEHIQGLDETIVGRAVLSPQDLERRNPNLVRGDIYSGATDLSQSYIWRPPTRYGSHGTSVDALYHCGASTYPGPGVNAESGRIVARKLLRRSERLRGGRSA